jgi:hypothetical protein
LIEVYGADKTGVKLSPIMGYNDMHDSHPGILMHHLIEEANKINLSFVEVNEGGKFEWEVECKHVNKHPANTIRGNFKKDFNGAWIANFGFTRETGN